ncbi:MAG: MCE family protein, partial [Maritimibacter sp.]|nr:MCE family protein [Maritimibacter sp.]
ISWVWLMPLLAVLVALGMVWQTYANRGPMIVVTFPSASGIEAGQTPLRFRELDVGTVEEVTFS